MKNFFSWKKLVVAVGITLLTFFIFPSHESEFIGWVSISQKEVVIPTNKLSEQDPFGLSCLATPVNYFYGQPLPFWHSVEGCGSDKIDKPLNPFGFLVDLVFIYLIIVIVFYIKNRVVPKRRV